MCILLYIGLLSICFGIGVFILKMQDENTCCTAPDYSGNARHNVGYWEDCNNGWYKGTLNGEHWKTRDKKIADAMQNALVSKDITTVAEIFENSVKTHTQDIIKEYDKLLEKTGEM